MPRLKGLAPHVDDAADKVFIKKIRPIEHHPQRSEPHEF